MENLGGDMELIFFLFCNFVESKESGVEVIVSLASPPGTAMLGWWSLLSKF